MPYNNSLDEELLLRAWESERGKVVVSVHSYNNGPKKLQITREIKNKEGMFTFAKLGRLSKEEIQGILPLIEEALRIM